METDDDRLSRVIADADAQPADRYAGTTLEELWALIKFRLVAQGSVERIDAEIDRMVRAWTEHIDASAERAETFRSRLFTLAREALTEDDEAMRKWRH